MQLHREKGLCYFCDDKFTFNHRFDGHHLSLNALKGGVGWDTIRFLAYIDKLLSDNFLQPRLAKFLKLPVEPAPMFKVMVNNGNYMASKGFIQKLAQLHYIRRMVHTNSIVEVYRMQMVDPNVKSLPLIELPTNIDPEIALLLHTDDSVFYTPSTLPPPRAHDHSISLMEGLTPVKVKPYCYPHSQMEEIERLVTDILQEGIIQPRYAQIAAPLIELLKKNAFKWTEAATMAFIQLKEALTTTPVLALPNFSAPFVLETDASSLGVGAVLSQGNHPIAYFSKKLSTRMQKQSAYTREFYATTEALAKFRNYLLGHKFIIKIDQKSLKELQQWSPKFLGFDFTIQYKPEKENVPTDALSRSIMMAWSEPTITQKDRGLKDLYDQCLADKLQSPEYLIKDGLLLWKGCIMLPGDEDIINQVLLEFHSSKVRGHAGVAKTMARICSKFFRHGMQQRIRKFVRECQICQQAKVQQALPARLLQPLPIPLHVWDDITMDFITCLPLSHGFSTIMIVVDRLSKFGTEFSLAHFGNIFSRFKENQKLSMRYFGPFEVVEKIGNVAYRLKLPTIARIHPVFHVFLIKAFKGSPSQNYLPLPLTTTEFGPFVHPLKSQPIPQILIQWESLDATAATWEDVAEIQESFPEFNLEDKVVFNGRSIVTGEKNESQTNVELNVGDKSVIPENHMTGDPQGKGSRKSMRHKRENLFMKDYVL
ncbi:hypothetical protein V8G54_009973 [Vigna mungo]|uniref:Uncharacterized protein n=1 Tax=Vigna mungo TaxID=3915 RepID=A0AAQ3NUY3_VIGMU